MQTNPDPANAITDDAPIPLHARLIAPTALSEAQRLTLHSLCLLFARAVNANMTRWLGVPFTASLAGVERVPFYEVIHSPEAEGELITSSSYSKSNSAN